MIIKQTENCHIYIPSYPVGHIIIKTQFSWGLKYSSWNTFKKKEKNKKKIWIKEADWWNTAK